MSRTLRIVLILISVAQLMFAVAFFIQWPPAINLWPLAGTTPLTYILLAAFFAVKRSLPPVGGLWLAATFAVGALAINLMPFVPGGSTGILAALHLPMALWLAVGVAYAAGRWRDHERWAINADDWKARRRADEKTL